MDKIFLNPKAIIRYMNLYYIDGWKDINNYYHVIEKENFPNLYQTMTLEEIIYNRIGTELESCFYFKYYLDKLDLPSKVYYLNDSTKKWNFKFFLIYHYNGENYYVDFNHLNRRIVPCSLLDLTNLPYQIFEVEQIKENITYEELLNYLKELSPVKKLIL